MQCPLRREIKVGRVPVYYHSQVQVLLEVMGLEIAHFVEYRPEGAFNAKEFVVTEVLRDREWFARYLPTMQSFCEVMNATSDDAVVAEQQQQCTVQVAASSKCEVVGEVQKNSVASRWLGVR